MGSRWVAFAPGVVFGAFVLVTGILAQEAGPIRFTITTSEGTRRYDGVPGQRKIYARAGGREREWFLTGGMGQVIVELRTEPRLAAARKGSRDFSDLYAEQERFLVRLRADGAEVRVRERYQDLFNGFALETTPEGRKKLKGMSEVKTVHPDLVARVPVIKDPGKNRAEDQVTLAESCRLIGATAAWEQYHATGKGVVVGVIDTGIDYRHPDLGGGFGPGCKVIGGYDCVDHDDDPRDGNGHGTHVAGIVAANGKVKGVAPDASLMAFRVLDNDGVGYYSTILAGLEKACNPDGDPSTQDAVHIINMSLGGTGYEDDVLCRAVDAAFSAGVTCVVAAGNEGPDKQTVGSPASSRRAITVAAVGRDGLSLAEFSSRGPTTGFGFPKPDLAAPGVAILSTVPGGGYASYSGTSMASPHAAGALAVLMSTVPAGERYYSWQWKNLLIASARSLPSAGPAEALEGVYAWGRGLIHLPAVLPLDQQVLFYLEDRPVATLGRYRPWDKEYYALLALTIENRTKSALTGRVSVQHAIPQGGEVLLYPAEEFAIEAGTMTHPKLGLQADETLPQLGKYPWLYGGTVILSLSNGQRREIPLILSRPRMIRYEIEQPELVPWEGIVDWLDAAGWSMPGLTGPIFNGKAELPVDTTESGQAGAMFLETRLSDPEFTNHFFVQNIDAPPLQGGETFRMGKSACRNEVSIAPLDEDGRPFASPVPTFQSYQGRRLQRIFLFFERVKFHLSDFSAPAPDYFSYLFRADKNAAFYGSHLFLSECRENHNVVLAGDDYRRVDWTKETSPVPGAPRYRTIEGKAFEPRGRMRVGIEMVGLAPWAYLAPQGEGLLACTQSLCDVPPGPDQSYWTSRYVSPLAGARLGGDLSLSRYLLGIGSCELLPVAGPLGMERTGRVLYTGSVYRRIYDRNGRKGLVQFLPSFFSPVMTYPLGGYDTARRLRYRLYDATGTLLLDKEVNNDGGTYAEDLAPGQEYRYEILALEEGQEPGLEVRGTWHLPEASVGNRWNKFAAAPLQSLTLWQEGKRVEMLQPGVPAKARLYLLPTGDLTRKEAFARPSSGGDWRSLAIEPTENPGIFWTDLPETVPGQRLDLKLGFAGPDFNLEEILARGVETATPSASPSRARLP